MKPITTRTQSIRSIWAHPAFVFCVLALLLNDWVLKSAWHNAFTGKLSDIAGLAAFPAFLCALWPGVARARCIYLITALVFIWWKLPCSEGAEAFLQHKLMLPVGRVTDPTDLWALIVLPLSYRLFIQRAVYWKLSKPGCIAMGFIAFIAFCADTPPKSYFYQLRGERQSEVYKKGFTIKQSPAQILARLRSLGYVVEPDTIINVPIYSSADAFYVAGFDSGLNGHSRKVEKAKDEMLYQQYIHPFRYRILRLPVKHDTLNVVSFHLEPIGDITHVRLSEIRSAAYDPRYRQLGRQAKRTLQGLLSPE
jgi:hypothetical protein